MVSDSEPGSRVGSRFGPYRLMRLLGRGGMGEVYEAEDTRKGRVVALKLISEQFSNNPVFRARMQREANTAGRLTEPHVVPIHDYGEIDGKFFVEMRLIEGFSLRSMLARFGPMSPARAVAIVSQIAAALDAAHASGVTHRDVKPENILITGDDFAYLVDFGIARAAADPGLTQTGLAMGTYNYMAPERFGVDEITYRADIYSLACVLGECLTGSPPYRCDSVERLIAAHLMQPPPRPSELRPGKVPSAIDEVIAKGMAKSPDDRYRSAGELARAAHEALTGTEQHQAAAILRHGDNATVLANVADAGPVRSQPPAPAPGTGSWTQPAWAAPRETVDTGWRGRPGPPQRGTDDTWHDQPVPPLPEPGATWRAPAISMTPHDTGHGQPIPPPSDPGATWHGPTSAPSREPEWARAQPNTPSAAGPAQSPDFESAAKPTTGRRKVGLLIGATALLLVIAVIVGYLVLRPSRSNTPWTAAPGQSVLPFTGLNFRFSPGGLALDSDGSIYATNQGMYGRVVKLAPGSTEPTVLLFKGLYEPHGLAVDSAGAVYVTDENNRVVKLPPGSNNQVELPITGLNYPEGVDVDSGGNVYVADRGNNRVVKLVVGSNTQSDLPFNGLNHPDGVAVDSGGNVYVTDSDNNRVVKLAAGSENQTDLPFTGLSVPWGVAVDSAGSVYVTEYEVQKVVKLAPGATTQTELPFAGLNSPLELAVDKSGNVYVADRGNNRVVRLAAG
jgi:serine/threonine-protein kinase